MPPQRKKSSASSGGASRSDTVAAIELKAEQFMLPSLTLLSADIESVTNQLADSAKQTPGYFHNTPVIVNLARLPAAESSVEFPLLVGLLRGFGMIPVAVRGGTRSQNKAALGMDLAVLTDGAADGRSDTQSATKPRRVARVKSLVLDKPIRSGQRVYAKGGDLILLANVSPGGEVIADGDIHVYGALRGRAIAGVTGNTKASIFCHEFQAELVSIAGRFRVQDQLDDKIYGQPVRACLVSGRFRLKPFRTSIPRVSPGSTAN